MTKLLGIALAGLPLLALAAANSPDESFYKAAAQGGLAEVEQGKLAQDKAQSQAVKDFGSMMVRDHSSANDKLKSLAASKGIELPSSPSVGQMATVGKLKALSGDTFDKSYIKGMVKDHKEDVAEFEKEAQSGKDLEAKKFAATTLPILREHLSKAQSIAAAAGVSTD